jgi:sulfate adenylyltransferase
LAPATVPPRPPDHGVIVWFTGLPSAGKTTYAAQEAFDAYDAGELGIEPLRFEHAFFCRRCDGMATSRTCPHPPASHLHLSGTAVRAMLERGELPPPELSRPEVARVLADGYRAASKE